MKNWQVEEMPNVTLAMVAADNIDVAIRGTTDSRSESDPNSFG
jgi:hypothetical protein